MKRIFFYILLSAVLLTAIEIEQLNDDEINALVTKLKSDPIDLNTADFDQLYELPFLDRSTCERIINYRLERTGFKTTGEVHAFLNIEEEYYKILRGCFVLNKPLKQIGSLSIQGRYKEELPIPAEIADSNWVGSSPFYQQNILFRYKNADQNLYSRFLTRKESGEIAAGTSFKYNLEYEDSRTHFLAGSFKYNSPSMFGWQNSSFSGSNSLSLQLKKEKSIKNSLSSGKNDINGFFGSYDLTPNFTIAAFSGASYIQSIKDSSGTVTKINFTHLYRTPAEISEFSETAYLLSGAEFQYLFNNTQLRCNILSQKFSDKTDTTLHLPAQFCSEILLKQKWNKFFISSISALLMPDCNIAWDLKNYIRLNQTAVELNYSYCSEINFLLPLNSLLASGADNEHNLSAIVTRRTDSEAFSLAGKIGFRKYKSIPDKSFLSSNIALTGEKKAGDFLYHCRIKNSISYQQYSTNITEENNSSYQFKINWRTDSLSLQSILLFINSNQDNRPYGYLFGQSADYQIVQNWSFKTGIDFFLSQPGITLTQTRTDNSSAVSTRFFAGQGNDIFLRIIYESIKSKFETGALLYRSEVADQENYRTIFDISIQFSL